MEALEATVKNEGDREDPDDVPEGYRWDPSHRRIIQRAERIYRASAERAAVDAAGRLVRFSALSELLMFVAAGAVSIVVGWFLVPAQFRAFPFADAAIMASRTAFVMGTAVVCWETQSALLGWLESKQLAQLRISLTRTIHERLLEESFSADDSSTHAMEPESPRHNIEGFGGIARSSRNAD